MFTHEPRTVYFHIGTIKTGSTHLQKFLYENRATLLEHDIDYIQFTPPRLDLPRWANADIFMEQPFDTTTIKETLAASSASKIVISEEGLMARPHVWQHDMFKDMRRVVVLYLRNSVELVASWASENSLPYNFSQTAHASGEGVVPIEGGLEKWAHMYGRMLAELTTAFDQDPDLEVIILPFPPQQGNLVGRFLSNVGLSKDVTDSLLENDSQDRVNEGRSRKYCDAAYLLTQFVKKYDISFLYSTNFVNEIVGLLKSGDDRNVMDTLSDSQMAAIQESLVEPVRGLVDTYGAPANVKELPKLFETQREPYSPIDAAALQLLASEAIIYRFRKSAQGALPSS